MYTRETFHLTDRITGASRHSIRLKGNDGEMIFCHNRVFNKIMSDPSIQFNVVVLPEHTDRATGRFYPESKWIVAYIPMRY